MGFLEIKWGNKSDDAPIATERLVNTSATDSAMAVIKANYVESQSPVLSAADRKNKLIWMNGAIRVLSLVSGTSVADLTKSVTGTVDGLSISDDVPQKTVTLVPSEQSQIKRPQKHPGAQREVKPGDALAEPDVSITSRSLRGNDSPE